MLSAIFLKKFSDGKIWIIISLNEQNVRPSRESKITIHILIEVLAMYVYFIWKTQFLDMDETRTGPAQGGGELGACLGPRAF